LPLKLEGKKRIVAEVREVVMRAQAIVIAEYRGLTVSEMDELRVLARKVGVQMRVVRNTLARRAVEDTPYACIQASLVGPVALAFSLDEPGSVARLIRDFAKTHNKLVVKNVALSGQLLDGAAIDKVAKLPTYEEAISTLMGTLQAPITKFVRTLAEPHTKLVRTLAAIRDSKQTAQN